MVYYEKNITGTNTVATLLYMELDIIVNPGR
jgi:hypothetical protein